MFSEKLKALRTAKKMSQKDLADKVGVAKSVVSFYESGDRFPSYDVLIKISRIFNVTTDYLLNEDYDSDNDIPAVKTATEETEALFLKKKHLHLIAAICFTVSCLCALIGVVNSSNDIQFALSCFMLALCAGNAVAQFILYFKKR